MRYLLDTHSVVWLLEKNERFPKHLMESAVYCEDIFYVSEMSLIEIIQLQRGNRINPKNRPEAVKHKLTNEWYISLEPVSTDILKCFYDLPVPDTSRGKHTDPFDRLIIATAIRRRMTLVSADAKFPFYRDNCGLKLMQI